MPKEKNRYARLGIGRWLNRSTQDLSVADNTTFEALKAGMDPQSYRRLQKLETQATELCEDMTAIQINLQQNPNTEMANSLFEEYMKTTMQHPKHSFEKRLLSVRALEIQQQLDAIPDSKKIVGLLAQIMELEPLYYTLYLEAEQILGDRMTPEWPFQPATKQKKEKKRKKK